MVKLALRIYEDSLCRCGHSMLLTQASDAKIAYRAKTVTCQACAAGERGREKDPAPGDITYVEDLRGTDAMDLDADDIMWMPDDDDVVPVDARFEPSAGDANLGADVESI